LVIGKPSAALPKAHVVSQRPLLQTPETWSSGEAAIFAYRDFEDP
jgi:hypothetical protein